MIICLCKNVSDRRIKELAGEGKTLCDVVKSCEAGTHCGACTADVRELIRKEHNQVRSQTSNRDC